MSGKQPFPQSPFSPSQIDDSSPIPFFGSPASDSSQHQRNNMFGVPPQQSYSSQSRSSISSTSSRGGGVPFSPPLQPYIQQQPRGSLSSQSASALSPSFAPFSLQQSPARAQEVADVSTLFGGGNNTIEPLFGGQQQQQQQQQRQQSISFQQSPHPHPTSSSQPPKPQRNMSNGSISSMATISTVAPSSPLNFFDHSSQKTGSGNFFDSFGSANTAPVSEVPQMSSLQDTSPFAVSSPSDYHGLYASSQTSQQQITQPSPQSVPLQQQPQQIPQGSFSQPFPQSQQQAQSVDPPMQTLQQQEKHQTSYSQSEPEPIPAQSSHQQYHAPQFYPYDPNNPEAGYYDPANPNLVYYWHDGQYYYQDSTTGEWVAYTGVPDQAVETVAAEEKPSVNTENTNSGDWIYHEESGMYYDQSSGQWWYWDQTSGQYVPYVSEGEQGGKTVETQVQQQENIVAQQHQDGFFSQVSEQQPTNDVSPFDPFKQQSSEKAQASSTQASVQYPLTPFSEASPHEQNILSPPAASSNEPSSQSQQILSPPPEPLFESISQPETPPKNLTPAIAQVQADVEEVSMPSFSSTGDSVSELGNHLNPPPEQTTQEDVSIFQTWRPEEAGAFFQGQMSSFVAQQPSFPEASVPGQSKSRNSVDVFTQTSIPESEMQSHSAIPLTQDGVTEVESKIEGDKVTSKKQVDEPGVVDDLDDLILNAGTTTKSEEMTTEMPKNKEYELYSYGYDPENTGSYGNGEQRNQQQTQEQQQGENQQQQHWYNYGNTNMQPQKQQYQEGIDTQKGDNEIGQQVKQQDQYGVSTNHYATNYDQHPWAPQSAPESTQGYYSSYSNEAIGSVDGTNYQHPQHPHQVDNVYSNSYGQEGQYTGYEGYSGHGIEQYSIQNGQYQTQPYQEQEQKQQETLLTTYEPPQATYTAQPVQGNIYEPTQQQQQSLQKQDIPSQSLVSLPRSLSYSSSTGFVLMPCPYPDCDGESKATAKFCSECGRSIAAFKSTAPLAAGGTITESTYEPTKQQQQQQYQNYEYQVGQYTSQESSALNYLQPEQQQQYYGQQHNDQQYNQPYGQTQYDYSNDYYQQQQSQQQQSQQSYGYGYEEPVTQDPLGRDHGHPLVVFGFGGRLLVMFPRVVQRFQSGYGAHTTKTMPGNIIVKNVKDLVSLEAALIACPLLGNGNPKKKKVDIVKFLESKIKESEQQATEVLQTEVEKERADGRVLLWKVLSAMIDREGGLSGNAKADEFVRNLLVPLKAENTSTEGFTVAADLVGGTGGTVSSLESDNQRGSEIITGLQDLLLKGDREAAVQYAMQEDLWAHALIISSCVNKDLWKEVVTGFVRRELSLDPNMPKPSIRDTHDDREGLRVLYSLFAGAGGAAMQEFMKVPAQLYTFGTKASLVEESHNLQKLAKWRETLALMLANRTPKDSEAMTALGDLLRDNGWIEAAHLCYLLSPQTSVHNGLDTPHNRLVLIGADQKHNVTSYFRDLDSIRRTEIFEFALSLTGPKENAGLPFLQAYKLWFAWNLADHGYVAEARQYCEAIAVIIKGYAKGNPYFHKTLVEKTKELAELVEAAGSHTASETGSSWLANKLPRPTLDSIWGSLEVKFNKFVSGDDLAEAQPEVKATTEIMSGPSVYNENPPSRTSSAAGISPRARTPMSAISASIFGRNSPGPRTSSPLNPTAQQGSMTSVSGYTSYPSYGNVAPESQQMSQSNSSNPSYYGGEHQNSSPYGYGASYGNESQTSYSPFPATTATSAVPNKDTTDGKPKATFYQAPAQAYTDSSNNAWWGSDATADAQPAVEETQPNTNEDYNPDDFISPMTALATSSPMPPTTSATQRNNSKPEPQWGEEDDLGLGNNSMASKKTPVPAIQEEKESRDPPTDNTDNTDNADNTERSAEEEKKEEKKGGWGFMGLFGRAKEEKPKAVKANLGEENEFYFDETEKRWINRRLGATPSPVATPPPPKSASRPVTPSQGLLTPPNATPARTASAPPNTSGPPRTGSAATGQRRTARARYVDVFNNPET